MKAIIGIDPGITGAIAYLDGDILKVVDTPTIQIVSGKSKKMSYDIQGMIAILRECKYEQKSCFIEKAQAMPGQGVTSMFGYGKGYGIWLGILSALSIPYTEVHPVTWKKRMMADMAKEKEASIVRVKQLFPNHAGLFTLKKHHGRADAVLIAEYGKRCYA